MGIVYTSYIVYSHLLSAAEGYTCLDQNHPIGFLLSRDKNREPAYRKPEIVERQKHFRERLLASAPSYLIGVARQIDEFILSHFNATNPDEGELLFLASDIHHPRRGIGTKLLSALAKHHPNQRIALLTDTNCSLWFYQRRGFELVDELAIPLPSLPDYRCFIYAKTL